MTIAETYAKFAHLDALLSDKKNLPDVFCGSILYDVWQAIKTAQAPCVWAHDPARDAKAWQTGCHISTLASPLSALVRFCPFCGLRVQMSEREYDVDHVVDAADVVE